jgi:trehalose-6-phosphatase
MPPDYSVRTTGSFVEKKEKAITFHHRNADPTWGEFQAKECQAILESMQERLDIDVMVGKRNLEVRVCGRSRGFAGSNNNGSLREQQRARLSSAWRYSTARPILSFALVTTRLVSQHVRTWAMAHTC